MPDRNLCFNSKKTGYHIKIPTTILTGLMFAGLLTIGMQAHAQALDTALVTNLAGADSLQFVTHAREAGFTVQLDTSLQVLLASKKELVFVKPLRDTGTRYYELSLVLSTGSVSDRELLLKRLRAVAGQRNTWTDDRFIYMEVDMDDPRTHQPLYKFLIYHLKLPDIRLDQ